MDRRIMVVAGGVSVCLLAFAVWRVTGGPAINPAALSAAPATATDKPERKKSYTLTGEAKQRHDEELRRKGIPVPDAAPMVSDDKDSLGPQGSPKRDTVKNPATPRERHPLDWSAPDQRILKASRAIQQKDIATAHREIRDLLAEEPLNPQAVFTEASALWAEGKADDAWAYVKALADENPRVPALRYVQARILMAAGRKLDAAKALDAYVEIAPNDKYVPAIRDLQEKVRKQL